jgi:SAM-dependent methyltransferase
VVACHTVLCHVPEPERALAEAFRVRLPALLRSVGFELRGSRSHGYLQTEQPASMLTLVDRGADALASWGRIGPELCASLKAEARRRAEADEFYGFIGFTSFIARKPG